MPIRFLKGLKNLELYRNMRLLRNLNEVAKAGFSPDKPLPDIAREISETLTRAPKIICAVPSADYDCRPHHPPEERHRWNVFFHLKIRITNAGGEATRLAHAELVIPGAPEPLAPHVYTNEGGAFSYIKADHYQTGCPAKSEQLMPLNFIWPVENETKKTIKAVLVLRFENCRGKKIPLKLRRAAHL